MKKLFSGAINGIKGLFSKSSGTQPVKIEKTVSADECGNKKPSASFEHIWKGMRTFFSRYNLASVCGAAFILTAIIAAVGCGIGNEVKNTGEISALNDGYVQTDRETPKPMETLTCVPEPDDGGSDNS